MSTDLEALVAHPNWRWIERCGARWLDGDLTGTVLGMERGNLVLWSDGEVIHSPSERWVPLREDPATLGCMEALVQGLWGGETHVSPPHRPGTEWHVQVVLSATFKDGRFVPSPTFSGRTKFAAIAAAIMAAPVVEIPEHHMRCSTCGLLFDMRQLDQVFAHEHTGPREATGIVGKKSPMDSDRPPDPPWCRVCDKPKVARGISARSCRCRPMAATDPLDAEGREVSDGQG